MKNSASAAALLLIIMIVAFTGCAAPEQKAVPLPQEKQEAAAPASADKADAAAAMEAAANLKQLAKNFYEFDKESYEAALSEGKYVFLDFYANWCPICKAEEPAIKEAFNELDANNVIGFRVNYNDDQTDNDEKALAKKFGITYQHTKIVIAPEGSVLSRTLRQQSRQEVLDQIKQATGATS